MRKSFTLRRRLAALMAVPMALSGTPAVTFGQTAAAPAGLVGEISLNPQIHYQTLEGWGTSLCWWGNVIGSAGDQDTGGDKRPDREEIAELAFSPDYLNLNIVRYNVGGGDKTESSIKRVEGRVPGWSKDMFGSDDGSGDFRGDTFYSKASEDMNDAGQIWMMEQANKYRKDQGDIINEIFSNSPPYYMTKSGSSTGGIDGNAWDKENLKDDHYDDFALYLARATKWMDKNLKSKGYKGIDYVEPLNEPDTDYWLNGSKKQEGCIFYPGASQIEVYSEMAKALASEGLSDVKLTGTDETSLQAAINSFNKLDNITRKNLPVIGAHTYSGSDEERDQLRKIAASYDKKLWMSEVTRGGKGHNKTSHDSMYNTNTQSQSEGIMADLKKMQSTAWIAWLVADSEYECIQTDSNWGLIHYVFEEEGPVPDYHTNLVNVDGTKKDGIPDSGYWDVTKQFYTMMQYSKYLKAGYIMVDIGDDNMCAAISPDRKELVIVAQNFGSDLWNTSVDLHALTNASKVELYRTSDTEDCKPVQTTNLSGQVLDVSLPSFSVSTFVITAQDGQVLYENDAYKKTVDCDIQTTADTLASGGGTLDKFTYNGEWYDGSWILEKYTTQKGASASFKFDGTQLALYGKKSPNAANLVIKVDGKDPVTHVTKADSEARRTLLYTTPMLEDGEHTVTIEMAESQESENPEIVLEYAEIIHGVLSEEGPRITDIAAHNQALTVLFDPAEGITDYTVECGTAADNMTVSAVAKDGKGILTGLTNGTEYFVRVKGGEDRFSSFEKARPAVMNEKLVYFVNAGTDRLYTPSGDESFGSYNSVMDQAYAPDEVTGKKWGYLEDQAIANKNRDADKWDSVRVGEQDIAGEGVTYQFDVDPGTYLVQVGMDDPWDNKDRSQDIIIQGDKKDTLIPDKQTIQTYSVIVDDESNLTIQVARPADNTDNNCDPLLNWIKIEKIVADEVISVDPLEPDFTVQGVVPALPQTVVCRDANNNQSEKNVVWNVSAFDFNVDNFTEVKVSGKVEGTSLEAVISIMVVPSNLQYFIDCNSLASTIHAKLKEDLTGLLNQDPDAQYSEGNWGYTETYDSHDADADDYLGNGWAAKEGQAITYQLPLEKGSYVLALGAQEWWAEYTESRPMKVTVSYMEGDAKKTVTGRLDLSKIKTEAVANIPVNLNQSAKLTISVVGTGGKDALLSYISVQNKVDHTALTAALGMAGTLDRTGCDADLLAILDNAVLAGHKLLTAANVTKEESEEAAKVITEALAALNVNPDFTEEELKENDYILYLANCGTPDGSIIPDGYKKGLLQSVVDQERGKDPSTGKVWGYAARDSYSAMDKNGTDASDITDSFMSMATDVEFDKNRSGLRYSFTLPSRDYEVTVGFKNPWSGRDVNVQLEGNTVQSGLKLMEGEVVEKQYVTSVVDGELNVMVHSPERKDQYGDPMISYIIVKAIPEYSLDLLKHTLNEMDAVAESGTWYEDGFAAYQEASKKAAEVVKEAEGTTVDLTAVREAYIKLCAAFAGLQERIPYESFTGVEGAPYYDTNGVLIQAHGGQIQELTVRGVTKYYWIGEDKTYDYRPVGGIHLYTSVDLYNWTDEGVVMRTMESMDEFEDDPYFKDLYGDYSQEKKEAIFIDLDKNRCVIERPKMIYNEKYDKYVIWFHADGRTPQYPGEGQDYSKANAGVAIADKPEGPYKLLGSYDLNYILGDDQGYDGEDNLGAVRDMNLFIDDDEDKTAYIIYSSQGNKTMFISRLNDSYTDIVTPRNEDGKLEHGGEEGVDKDFTANFKGWSREAPAMFKYNEKYYMITSGCTGWSPNPGQYAVADHPMGPWTSKGDPCDGEQANTTFSTQSTCVIPVDAEKGKFIYMGDRWFAGDLSDSRYVWLPIEFLDDDQLVLKRYSNWTKEELDNKGVAKIQWELPTEYESLKDLAEVLPETVDISIGGQEISDAEVSWAEIDTDLTYMGEYRVLGKLGEENGSRSVSFTANIINSKTSYFFDSAADSSKYFDILKTAARGLKNNRSDQLYSAESGAGYLGEKTIDFDSHDGADLYSNGWWAKEGKNIEYAFDLEPGEYTVVTGYQEWWDTKRDMKLSAVVKDAGGEEIKLADKEFTLEAYDLARVEELRFTVTKADADKGSVIIRIAKTDSEGADPVLSFVGIIPEKTLEGSSISGTVTAGDEADSVKGIKINLYKGNDITTATPSDAVKTDEDGAYLFENLEDGDYTVELPEMEGYEKQDAKEITVAGKDVKGVDFALVKEGSEEGEKETEIRITSPPSKRRYVIGETLDVTGLIVTLYIDGTAKRVLDDDEITVSNLNSDTAGTKKITVTYTEEKEGTEKPLVCKVVFEVIVYEEKLAPSIKIVKKPTQMNYLVGEDLNPDGMEVRGVNLSDEHVTILEESEYEIDYDFVKAGTSKVTVTYTLEDEHGLSLVLEDSFEVRVFGEEETEFYTDRIDIIRNPFKMIYEAGDEFEEEGMIVERTVKVVATSSNATYKERIPVEHLEIEAEEFSKTGTKKVKVIYYEDGETGEEKTYTDTLTVTVSKQGNVILEGNLAAVQKKLEQALLYGDYLTKEEKLDAFTAAINETKGHFDHYDPKDKISDKAFGIVEDIEAKLLKTYTDITTIVKADSKFGSVFAEGMALSADLGSDKPQQIKLEVKKPVEEVPKELTDQMKAYVGMDITLYKDQEEMQPELPIRIQMEIPGGLKKDNLLIHHYHDGGWSIIVPTLKGNQMSFYVSELSLFVAANAKNKPVPPVDDGTDNKGDSGSDGNQETPVITIPGTWMKDDTGWWYQKKAGGYISSSWAQIDGKWYFFNEAGYMVTGWLLDRATWYYMNEDGSMAAGRWVFWKDQWYYMTQSGVMAVNTITPDGYRVDGDGVWIRS